MPVESSLPVPVNRILADMINSSYRREGNVNVIDQMGEPTASTSSESEKWTNAASLKDESAVALYLAESVPFIKE